MCKVTAHRVLAGEQFKWTKWEGSECWEASLTFPQTDEPLGERRLVKGGVPARTARHVLNLAKEGGWLVTMERALELAALPKGEREHHSLQYPRASMDTKTAPPKPQVVNPPPVANPSPEEKPKGQKLLPFPSKTKTAPDRPQAHGGSLKSGSGVFTQPLPSADAFEPESLPEGIRFLQVQVARAKSVYEAALAAQDVLDEESVAVTTRALGYYMVLVSKTASLTRDLESSGQLGDTRSVSEIVRALTGSSAIIRARFFQLPDLLHNSLADRGPDFARVASQARDICRELVEGIMRDLSVKFDSIQMGGGLE
jgi:hypothetical protein